MICDLPERTVIEQWRVRDGLSQRAIRQRMADELGITVSVGTVANHFKAVDAGVAEAVESEVLTAAAAQAGAAMQVFPDNIAHADRFLGGLCDLDGKLRRPQFVPYAVSLLKERRESALASLRFTPADPANQAAQSLADLVSRVFDDDRPADRPGA